MHPSGNTALPPTPLEKAGGNGNIGGDPLTTLGRPGDDMLIETESLFAGRVAFVLGRRGRDYAKPRVTGITASNQPKEPDPNPTNRLRVPFRQANQLAAFAVGGSDVNTMQRMCSFEYLQRYFYFVLKTKIIVIGAAAGADFPDTMGFSPDVLKVRGLIETTGSMTNVNGAAVMTEIARRHNRNDNLPKPTTKLDKLQNSGIFLADEGPFLRGKTLETTISKIGHGSAPIAASIGDIVAFGRLQEMIAQSGACDWVPDGIVHSKLSQGDTIMDEELDSRDGQLYNVTVGGPAIASSWTNDKHLEVMPLDKVFVVIVADVWDNVDETVVKAHHKNATDGTYEHELLGKIAASTAAAVTAATTAADKAAAANGVRDENAREGYFAAGNKKAVITNMRVRLTTSSEMISCSSFKGKNNQPGAQGADAKASKATYFSHSGRDRHSRMGLMLSGDDGVSEYIIGGWCIGTVLDSAAARSSMQGVPLVGAVKRQRTSHASNVKVKVEWWSADRLYRSFMNVNGGIRTRYNGVQNAKAVTNNKVALSKALSRPP